MTVFRCILTPLERAILNSIPNATGHYEIILIITLFIKTKPFFKREKKLFLKTFSLEQ